MVVMLVPLGATVAFAADQLIYCKAAPCYGTGNEDKIFERQRNRAYDRIILKRGHDVVLANGYTNDTDIVKGGSGYDKIKVNDGDSFDGASGGAGVDWCIVGRQERSGYGLHWGDGPLDVHQAAAREEPRLRRRQVVSLLVSS
jgi:hypothetical protein